MTNLAQQYSITQEPFYQPQSNEVGLYEAAYNARLPVMVKGPTGCGKSRFIEYMAFKLGKPLITVACNEDMTASDLVGRYLLEANGTRWLDGPLATAAAGLTARWPPRPALAPFVTWMKSSRRARTPPWSSTRSPTTVASCLWTKKANSSRRTRIFSWSSLTTPATKA
jgi:hypothetical protein